MNAGIRKILWLLGFLVVVAAAVGVFAYLQPERAKESWMSIQTFISSPQVRGFRWPKVEGDQFKVTYEDEAIPRDYANAILQIAVQSHQMLQEELGRTFIQEIDIYVFTEEERHYFWTNGVDEIHLVFESTNDMLPPGMGGNRNHVAQIAHQIGLLVARIRSGGDAAPRPRDRASEALATYLEMNLFVPGLWRREKELLWPAPYNYYAYERYPANQGVYERHASDPPEGMAAGRFWDEWDTFWYRLDRHGGPEAVGEVLNQAAGPMGVADLQSLVRGVRNVTEDDALVEFLQKIDQGE